MKTFFAIAVLLIFSAQAQGQSYGCDKEVNKAMKDCDGAATGAFMTNNKAAKEVSDYVASQNGLIENAGTFQAQVAANGLGTIKAANISCTRSRNEMNEKCEEARRRATSKQDNKEIADIDKNEKEGSRYIDKRQDGLEKEMTNLAGRGVAGGGAVSASSNAGN